MKESFSQGVYRIVARVPRGRVTTYGQIALLLGSPRAGRQVGWAMRNCPDDLPWQRVVKADGAVAGGDFAAHRRGMLEAEGVRFLQDGRVDLAACRWNPEGADTAE
jgi:methylated-DNA-protein-cysteine methyltransferase related protein